MSPCADGCFAPYDVFPLQKGAGEKRRAPKSEQRVWLQMGLGVDIRLGWAWDILGKTIGK